MSKLKISPKPYITIFIILAILGILATLSVLFFPVVSIDSGVGEPVELYLIDGFTNPEKFDAIYSYRIVHPTYTESLDIADVMRILAIFIFIFPFIGVIIFPINVMRRNKVADPVKFMKAQVQLPPSIMCGFFALFLMFGAQKIVNMKGELVAELTSVTTYTYIPAIVCIVLFIVATVFHSHYKGAVAGKHAPLCAAKYPPELIEEEPEEKTESEDDVINAISKYKALYDNGTITKEEFEAKKAELLKK